MKLFLIFVCLVAFVTADEFKNFKSTYGKNYKSPSEETYRANIFSKNIKSIEMHNARYEKGLETYKQAVNEFADMTTEEFLEYLRLSGPKPNEESAEFYNSSYGTPNAIDWRTKGAVTPVGHQGQCGSCWAFSAAGSMESMNKIRKGRLISLSKQNLVDCCRPFGANGCKGGSMSSAFRYVQVNGINTEHDYPYRGVDGQCRFQKNKVALRIRGYAIIRPGKENDLVHAVGNVGPVSIAIATTDKFQFYHSGIFSDPTCNPQKLNHGMLAVGYTGDAIIFKNSWGTSWGESGYIRIKRGSNMCGIANSASFPIL